MSTILPWPTQNYLYPKGKDDMAHTTLNHALQAADIDLAVWPIGFNIGYNQTARIVSNGLFVSVCRFANGDYETAISYASQCEDFQTIVEGV